MIKNDINLITKRKSKQYSSKNLIITIGIVVIVGIGIVLGIMLPTQKLNDTKAAVSRLDNELQQYSGLALSAGGTQVDSDIDPNAGLDVIYMEKVKKLQEYEDQLESLILISTAESNALAYIEAIEESVPSEVNLTSLSMMGEGVNINGVATGDTALATFCLRLRETGVFSEVLVNSSMVVIKGNTAVIFNLTASINGTMESMQTMTAGDEEAGSEGSDEGI